MIKAVIFDMDGVMVQSDHIHQHANDILLKMYGHSHNEIPRNTIKKFLGLRVIDSLSIIKNYFHINDDLQKLADKRQKIFFSLLDEIKPMPGIVELIKNLKKYYYLALATSGTQNYVDFVLSMLKLENYFDAVVTGDDVKNGKPDPEVFILAASNLKCQPDKCIVIEDAFNGIQAAKKAGMKVIALRNGYNSDQNISLADAIAENLDMVFEKIKRI